MNKNTAQLMRATEFISHDKEVPVDTLQTQLIAWIEVYLIALLWIFNIYRGIYY